MPSIATPLIPVSTLDDPPATHREGPILLNVSRYLEMPQVVAMAAERCRVRLATSAPQDWAFPLAVAKTLGWNAGQLRVDPKPAK
jgi:hypothetical protein